MQCCHSPIRWRRPHRWRAPSPKSPIRPTLARLAPWPHVNGRVPLCTRSVPLLFGRRWLNFCTAGPDVCGRPELASCSQNYLSVDIRPVSCCVIPPPASIFRCTWHADAIVIAIALHIICATSLGVNVHWVQGVCLWIKHTRSSGAGALHLLRILGVIDAVVRGLFCIAHRNIL